MPLALPLVLAENTAPIALSIVFGALLLVSLVAACFPAIRRANALAAPILVVITVAVTGVLLGVMLYIRHTFGE